MVSDFRGQSSHRAGRPVGLNGLLDDDPAKLADIYNEESLGKENSNIF